MNRLLYILILLVSIMIIIRFVYEDRWDELALFLVAFFGIYQTLIDGTKKEAS